MVLIVDNTQRKMRREVKEALFSLCIPCSVTSTEKMDRYFPVGAVIATEKYIFSDVKYMAEIYNCPAYLYDENEDILSFVLKIYGERYNTSYKSFMLEFSEEELYVCRKHIRLTDTEKMIFKMLLSAEDWTSKESLALYCLKDPCADKGTISVHISNINKKVKAATGFKLIEFKRFSGYRLGLR